MNGLKLSKVPDQNRGVRDGWTRAILRSFVSSNAHRRSMLDESSAIRSKDTGIALFEGLSRHARDLSVLEIHER